MKIIAKNKRASYDYALKEKYEAGVMLQGTEVKSLRQGKATIAEAYISIDKNDEIWATISISHNMNLATFTTMKKLAKESFY